MSRYVSAFLVVTLLSPSMVSAAPRLRHVAIELRTGEVIEGQLEAYRSRVTRH